MKDSVPRWRLISLKCVDCSKELLLMSAPFKNKKYYSFRFAIKVATEAHLVKQHSQIPVLEAFYQMSPPTKTDKRYIYFRRSKANLKALTRKNKRIKRIIREETAVKVRILNVHE